MGLVCCDIGTTNCGGDEGAMVIARNLSHLKRLRAYNFTLGLEGAAFISMNLVGLRELYAGGNPEVHKGGAAFGRLSSLESLNVGTN